MSQSQTHRCWAPQSYVCISNSPTLQNLDTYFTWIQFQPRTWNYLKQYWKSLKIRDLSWSSVMNESVFFKMKWSLLETPLHLEVRGSAPKPLKSLKVSLLADCLTVFGQITCTFKMSWKANIKLEASMKF